MAEVTTVVMAPGMAMADGFIPVMGMALMGTVADTGTDEELITMDMVTLESTSNPVASFTGRSEGAVTTPTVTDGNEPEDLLVQRVVTQLQSQLGSRVRDFRLSVHQNRLILRGQVRTYYCKQLVQEIVMKETPLLIAANEIAVLHTSEK
jgi:hypothetical protein